MEIGAQLMTKTILFLAANPSSTTSLAIDIECREIESKIRAHDLKLLSRWAVRTGDLLQYLHECSPHIVHFSGHGSPKEELILLDELDSPKPVSKEALRQLFATLKDNIRLVVLNACYSRPQALAITEVVDCAVGMQKAIGDRAAIVFATAFYQAIGFGRSVRVAFEAGKAALMLEGISDETTPELLVRDGIDANKVILMNGGEDVDADSFKIATEARRDSVGLKAHFRYLANADVVVNRSYLEGVLVNDTFTFGAFSDTGTPHDPVVWIHRDGARIPGNVGQGFFPNPKRKHSYICTAAFEHQAQQAPHHILTKYRWKGAGILSRDALQRVPAEAKGFLYSRYLEHAWLKSPSKEEVGSLDISVDLPREWAPEDNEGAVFAYTKHESAPESDPELSPSLTKRIFSDGDGHFSLLVKAPVPGTTYILAWSLRDRPRE